MPVSAIEKELVEASGFEPTRNYERQDYLAALARAVNEIAEDEFDAMSTDAQDWFNDAVKALNKKKELPEFPDASTEAEVEEAAEAEEEPDPTDDNPEAEGEEEAAPKAKTKKAAPAPKKNTLGKVAPRKLQVPPSPAPGLTTDRYGLGVQSKGHQAVMLFEQGCRMSDVTESIGGTYYNLITKLVKSGHKLEKAANGYLKLTHKDDVSKKGKVKK